MKRTTIALLSISLLTTSGIAATLPELHDQALQILKDLPQATVAKKARLAKQASALLQERAKTLKALMQKDPAQALAQGFTPDQLSQLTKAFPESSKHLETLGEATGQVEEMIADDFKGKRSWRVHYLRTAK